MKASQLEIIFRSLNDAGMRYLVAGGLAVVAHGYVRLTMDIDLIVQLVDKNLTVAMGVFGQLDYRPKVPVKLEDFARFENRERWIAEKGMVVFQLVSDKFPTEPIDIFAREPFDFDLAYMQAPRFEIADGVNIPVIALRELIKLKKEANRPKDQVDLLYLAKLAIEKSDE